MKSLMESYEEAVADCDDLAMFKSYIWPVGSRLPVLRLRVEPGEIPDLGLLYRTDWNGGYAVLFTYIFDDDYLTNAKKIYYSSPEDVVSDGWMVDN